MSAEADRRLTQMLDRILQEGRQLQKVGRLQDRMSRREIALLEHQLRVLQAGSAATDGREKEGAFQWTAAILAHARELQAASLETRARTRRLRKERYRLRLITGTGGSQGRSATDPRGLSVHRSGQVTAPDD